MVLVTKLLKRTVGEDNKKTEMFMTANRSVNTGLTASAVVSVSEPRILPNASKSLIIARAGSGAQQCSVPLSSAIPTESPVLSGSRLVVVL